MNENKDQVTAQNEITEALEHVDPKRRGFLAKLIAGGAVLPAMTTVAFGQGKGKGGAGKAKGGKGKGGGAGAAGKGKGAQGKGNAGADRDPAKFAARLIQQFDKDGDKALNLQELTAALQAMGQRRAQQGAGKGKGANGQGKGVGKGQGGNAAGKGKGIGQGAGKGKGAQSGGGGGVVPKKPGS